jgi:lysozyme
MRTSVISGLALIACALAFAPNAARTQQNEEQLLKNTSRSALFQIVVREELREQGMDVSILGADILRRFLFPGDADANAIYGIDISHHNEDGCNCKINWSDVESQKVVFAYLKATQGATGQDARFADNWNSIATTKVLRGAYHFLSPFSSPEDQVKNFLATMGPLRPHDLPPVMDIEWTDATDPDNDGWRNMSPNQIVEFALKWLDAVEAQTGRTPLIYTSRTWWKDRITDANLSKFQKYQMWLAQYVPDSVRGQNVPTNLPAQWTTWTIWQFTDSGGFKVGLPREVDVSVFKGTPDSFYQKLGVILPTSPPVSTDNQPPDTPKDANLTPGGNGAPNNTPMPAVGDTPTGPPPGTASTPAANPTPAKDAKVSSPASNPLSDVGLPAAGGNAPKNTSTSSPPRNNRDQGSIGLGGNPEIRSE